MWSHHVLFILGPAYVFKTCSTNLDCILIESHDRIVILTTFVYKLIDCILVESHDRLIDHYKERRG
jgi:hypothetical protein